MTRSITLALAVAALVLATASAHAQKPDRNCDPRTRVVETPQQMPVSRPVVRWCGLLPLLTGRCR